MFWRRKRIEVIKPAELAAKIIEGNRPVIVDVRSGKDFVAGHLPGAVNIPLEELEQRREELDSKKATVFY